MSKKAVIHTEAEQQAWRTSTSKGSPCFAAAEQGLAACFVI